MDLGIPERGQPQPQQPLRAKRAAGETEPAVEGGAAPPPRKATRRGSFLRAPPTRSKEAVREQKEGADTEGAASFGKVKRSESFGRVCKRFKRVASFG